MLIDGRIFVEAELHPLAVVDVAHATPGRVALDLPLSRGADLGRPLLELDRVAASVGRVVDQAIASVRSPLWLMPISPVMYTGCPTRPPGRGAAGRGHP